MIFILWEWLRGGIKTLSLNLSQPDADVENELAVDTKHLEASKQRAMQMERRLAELEFQKAFIEHGRHTAH